MILTVREFQKTDFRLIVEYFNPSRSKFLRGMGIDPTKQQTEEKRIDDLNTDFKKSLKEKESFYLIWLINNKPIGHTRINKISYGEEAYMHLHIWNDEFRKMGLGTHFLKDSIPYFFKYFKLKRLYCQPYSLNPAPNKTLIKLGFKFVKNYETVPAPICFKQTVNLYVINVSDFKMYFTALP